MPRGDPRLAPLPVRLTVVEKAKLKKLADDRGETLSDAARYAILEVHDINQLEVRRRQQARTLSKLGETLGELRRIGGLYALQAKTNRPVPTESQAALDTAIARTAQVMVDLLS